VTTSTGKPGTDPEVFAIRYASRVSTKGENFLNFYVYGEPDGVLAVDYFYWVIRDDAGVTVVDTGFAPEAGRRRGRTAESTPRESLTALGIHPAEVGRVVITHAHYDHIGNLDEFPAGHRLTLIEGDHQIGGGIRLIEVGGHTPGQLIVAAHGVLLASDALHFYDELERDRPFAIAAMYRAYDTLAGMAAEPRTRLVAGHDPRVRSLFPTEGDITCLTA
jgi:glyoxylase-like metal-dependent hydrolase (beta-lactamase superfamily II)